MLGISGSAQMLDLKQDCHVRPRLFTVAEYYQMARAGILHPDEYCELIAGQVILVPPQGPAHAATLRRVIKYLRAMLPPEEADISSGELPITLGEFDEPIPDIAVVRPDASGQEYFAGHPQATDVLLLIEVAVTSLDFDRTVKSQLYGRSNILEYWVLDVATSRVHRFTEPAAQGYLSETLFCAQDTICALAFPTISLTVEKLFIERAR
jgi:Uma2 family endonuclease